MSERHYCVKEFAQLGGITVRTLHYYDQIDLLKPASISEAGHRFYNQESLLRLQHILMLKWLGFSLEHVQDMLSQPDHDLLTALQIQHKAIHQQMRQLQSMDTSLTQAIDYIQTHPGDDLPDNLVQALLSFLNDQEENDWAQSAYSDEAWAGVQTRRWAYSVAEFESFQQMWEELIAEFSAQKNLPPDSPPIQALAERMDNLLGIFTAGDQEVEMGLEKLWSNPENIPAEYRNFDRDVFLFMNEALQIYRQQNEG